MTRAALLLFLLCFATASAAELQGTCTAVTDGDTIQLTTATRETHKIRLAGIDAPEKTQAFGQKAKQALSTLCYGQTIRARVQDRDRYGRQVADVFRGPVWLNAEQVRAGLAWHYRQYSDNAELAALEAAARAGRTGLWIDPMPVAPWDFRASEKNLPSTESVAVRPAPREPVLAPSCRTCSQYKTCAEARAALKGGCHKLDKDGDGRPCESLCR